MLAAIWLAGQINELHRGAVIAAWEVYDLPDEWLDALTGMARVVPGMASGKQKVEGALEKWRKGLPNYRQ